MSKYIYEFDKKQKKDSPFDKYYKTTFSIHISQNNREMINSKLNGNHII
ncbi:MAG: hypothetical protein RR623_05465 [Bacilli bacterium]